MTSKSLILIFAALAPLAATATGAETPPAGPRMAQVQNEPNLRLRRLVQQLSLSEQQKEAIRPILEEESESIKAAQRDPLLSPLEKREKRLQILEKARLELGKVLTTQQQKIYDDMLEKGRAQRDAFQAAQEKAKAKETPPRRPEIPFGGEQKKFTLMPPEK